MQNYDAYSQAKRNVDKKIRFFIHLAIYLCVNAMLVSLNIAQHIDVPWSFGPVFGWGIGLFFHGVSVFFRTTDVGWKRRMIEREMEKQYPKA